MADNYAEYINNNLNGLQEYINHIVEFEKKYKQTIQNLYDKKHGFVEKAQSAIDYEQEMKEA